MSADHRGRVIDMLRDWGKKGEGRKNRNKDLKGISEEDRAFLRETLNKHPFGPGKQGGVSCDDCWAQLILLGVDENVCRRGGKYRGQFVWKYPPLLAANEFIRILKHRPVPIKLKDVNGSGKALIAATISHNRTSEPSVTRISSSIPVQEPIIIGVHE